jgi:prickle
VRRKLKEKPKTKLKMLDCPLKDSEIVNSPLIPWAGMRYSCVKVLNLYCKVFSQQELFELIVR